MEKCETTQGILRRVRTFVLRQRRMTASQERAYEELHEKFCIRCHGAPLDFAEIFGNPHPVTVEIGFGMGQATAKIAAENRGKNYLCIEVHRPGVGSLLNEVAAENLENVRIVESDAIDVLENSIANGSVAAFHIFFPDPWPKKRHCKRRLVQRPNTDLFERKLASGGYVYFVSDWEDYARFALAELSATDGLENQNRDFAPRQTWRPETNFERKALAAGREIFELVFKKT